MHSRYLSQGGCRGLRLLLTRKPNAIGHRKVLHQRCDQAGRIIIYQDVRPMRRFDELLADGVIQKLQKPVEIAEDVKQPARLLVKSEQTPAYDLGEFFERTETSGERYKGVGQFGHQRFALVH